MRNASSTLSKASVSWYGTNRTPLLSVISQFRLIGCCRRGYLLIARPAPGVSLVHHEIELPPRRRVDLENLEHTAAEIGKGMGHAGGNVHQVVLADDVGLGGHGQRALAALDDIDVVGLGVVMPLAARSARHQPVEMDVDLLGAEAGIDQLDLLAPSGLHRARRTFIQMQDFEHARSPTVLAAATARMQYP